MAPGKQPPHKAVPAERDTDVNQRTGTEDRATRDSFGDMDEAAEQSSPSDNPALVTAIRGGGTSTADAAIPGGGAAPVVPPAPGKTEKAKTPGDRSGA